MNNQTKTIKNSFLGLVILTFFITSPIYGQIKMESTGNIALGESFGQLPAQEVDIFHRLFLRQVPRVGTPGYSYSGVSFITYINGSQEDPIMEPQWNNTYWIGRPGSQFWQIHANQFYASNVLITSDARLKTNLKPVTNSLSRLLNLQPYTYDYKFVTNEKVSDAINQRIEAAAKKQIGFKAQDLQEDFPNLVFYDAANDKYSLNYIGLIPEMVAAIKEQNNVIDELKQELEMIKGNCCNSTSPSSTIEGNELKDATLGNTCTLEQNHPNPFNQETTIKYYITEQSSQATMYIYDMNGKQIDKYELTQKGNQSLTIQKNKLRAAIYLYSLIVDGNEIATKKMILTE